MREKKSMKKISDAEVRETAMTKNRKRHFKEVASKLQDTDLFTVNVNKDGLHTKREKLAADRFKRKNTEGNLRSKTEVALMKKLSKKGPPAPIKQEQETLDVWGSSTVPGFEQASKNVQKFKAFAERSKTKVKSVITPHAG